MTTINNKERANARHDASLPFETFIERAYALLGEEGCINVILPIKESEIWKALALRQGFFVQEQIYIKPKPSKPYNRVIVVMGKKAQTPVVKEYTIYNDDGSQTDWYRLLCQEFYR